MLPILIETSWLTLFSYPLFMGLGWGSAYAFTRYIFEKYELSGRGLPLLFIAMFVSSWIGAKVFFLWFSASDKFSQYLYADNFWLGGGFVFYGGFIFSLITYFMLTIAFKKLEFRHSKYLAPGLALGHAIGRIGCFLTGCCFGEVCDLPWAIHMHGFERHPVQLYEAAGLFVLFWLMLRMLKQQQSNIRVFCTYILFYSSLRFVVEFFRGDIVRGIHTYSLSTSQWVSLALIGLTLIAWQKFKA